MSNLQKFKFGISGHVKPGFEPVIHFLEKLGKQGWDKQSQLNVWVAEECVIDVVMTDKPGFSADSKTTIHSAGKSVCACIFGQLVDQGLIKYEEKVSTYWPEFA